MKRQRRCADVSVILPVYNCADFLDECFNGLIEQSFQGSNGLIEISIFNDCSTDDTLNICKQWSNRFIEKGFLWVLSSNETGENIGPGHARNKAVAQSSGEYICIHDCDDISHKDRILEQIKAARIHPGALIGTRFSRTPKDSTKRYNDWYNSLTPDQLELQQYRELTLVQPTWFMARRTFDLVGGYAIGPDEEFKSDHSDANRFGLCEDLKFFYKYLDETETSYTSGKLNRRLVMVPKILLTYRYVPGSMSSQTPRKVLLRLRVRAFERRVLSKWTTFTIWGVGRDGKDFYNMLRPEFKEKVKEFLDIDEKKIKNGYHNTSVKKTYNVRHFSEATPPIVICVALTRVETALKANINTLKLTEGVDYYHFT